VNIYVASSWRNDWQQVAVEALKQAGFDVYDFKHPPGRTGFAWSQIDPNWKAWSTPQFVEALEHPIARAGFQSDMRALTSCRAVLLVMPCGRSAHAEAGFAKGAGKTVYVWQPRPRDPAIRYEPELMYRMFDGVDEDLTKIVNQLVYDRWLMGLGERPAGETLGIVRCEEPV
jgi:hypothetical protein